MQKIILAIVDDIFFAAKIRGTAEQYGSKVIFPKSPREAFDVAFENRPIVIISDLQANNIDPFEFAGQVKACGSLQAVPLVGFFSHVNVEIREKAKKAGYDFVIPRSVLSKDLPQIVQGKLGAST